MNQQPDIKATVAHVCKGGRIVVGSSSVCEKVLEPHGKELTLKQLINKANDLFIQMQTL